MTLCVDQAGCQQGFSPWGDDATVVLTWTIDGIAADEASCTSLGGDQVRMSINREPVDWFDSRLQWDCEDGGAYMDSMFRTGDFHVRWDLLDASGEPLASTQWVSVQLADGENALGTVDFNLP